MADAVQALQEQVQSGAGSIVSVDRAKQPKQPSLWALDAVNQATLPQWDPTISVAVQEQTITMTFSQLTLFRESAERSREALKAAMAGLCDNLSKLQHEVGIMNNTISALDDLIARGAQ